MSKGSFGGLWGKLAIGGGVYGGYLGLKAAVNSPKNMQDAQDNSTWGSFAKKSAVDIGLSLADDVPILLLAPILTHKIKSLKKFEHGISGALGVGGAAVGAGFVVHDYRNMLAARQYIADRDPNDTRSQIAAANLAGGMPVDPRLNAINGFVNQGIAGQQRVNMTGIGSPSSQGIMYNLNNNPFANWFNNQVAPQSSNLPAQDPVAKALQYSSIGGFLGTALGSRGGLGRSALWGAIGGFAGGALGVYQANNPDLHANLEGYKETLLLSTPVVGTAALLFGASKIPGVGGLISKGMFKTGKGIANTGEFLAKVNPDIKAFGGNIAKWPMQQSGVAALKFQDKFEIGKTAADRVERAAGFQNFVGNTVAAPTNISSNIIGNFLVPAFNHTNPEGKGAWEQSLGIAHIGTFIPHQILTAGAVAGVASTSISNKKKTRGKHASTTMPSNNSN